MARKKIKNLHKLLRSLPLCFVICLCCHSYAENHSPAANKESIKPTPNTFEQQRQAEIESAKNGFTLLPHRSNFLMPVSFANIKDDPYIGNAEEDEYHDAEIYFQFSVKYLLEDDFIFDDLDLLVGFTAASWWQAYNGDISRPFRATDYQPEIFLRYTHRWKLLGATVEQASIAFNHQSNGQSGVLSRSWNRIIAGLSFAPWHNINWHIDAWWRLPEDDKENGDDPHGDDNPNIEKYLGYGQLSASWRGASNHHWKLMLRHNLRSDAKGAVQLDWSKPFRPGLEYYVSYFNGYGDSLIYYNETIQRISLGFKF